MNDEGVMLATRLVAQRFPGARAAWLGGSVAAGQQTATSDLDITVLLDGSPAPYRSSEVVDGRPVEFFAHTEDSLLRFCESDRDRRRPTMMRLVGSSVVLLDRDGSGLRLRAALHRMARDGPPSVTDRDLETQPPAFADDLQIRPMTARDATLVAAWRYSGPWTVYDLPSAQPIVDDLPGYFAVVSSERLVGFCCVGQAARIPGMTEEPGVLDIGLGMNAELVGRGFGDDFGRAVLAFLNTTHPDKELRAVVQAWNERSLRLTRRLGFDDAGELTATHDGRPVAYRILKRPKRSNH